MKIRAQKLGGKTAKTVLAVALAACLVPAWAGLLASNGEGVTSTLAAAETSAAATATAAAETNTAQAASAAESSASDTFATLNTEADTLTSANITSTDQLTTAGTGASQTSVILTGSTAQIDSLTSIDSYEVISQTDGQSVCAATLTPTATVEGALLEAASAGVEAQQNNTYTLLTKTNDTYACNTTGSFVNTSSQYYNVTEGFTTAWDYARAGQAAGGGTVEVAVLDSGVMFTHEDLAANIDTQLAYNVFTKSTLTESSTGVFTRQDLTAYHSGDYNGHGTAVAGVIAGIANNACGITGASYNAKILPVACFNSEGAATTSDVLEALEYVDKLIETGAANIKIVNCSYGTYENDDALESRMRHMYAEHNVLFVCAGGNGENGKANTKACYPSDYDFTLSVTATTSAGAQTAWADYNAQKDIAAAGEGIVTTYAKGTSSYIEGSGTSFSAPLVAGAAALLYSIDANLTPDQVKQLLKSTATQVSGQPTESGSAGQLNAGAAVEALIAQSAEGVTSTLTYFADQYGELPHKITQPTCTWSAGNLTCTASGTCSDYYDAVSSDGRAVHTLAGCTYQATETATVTYSVRQAATTEAPGVGVYTATFSNRAFETQTIEVEIAQLEANAASGNNSDANNAENSGSGAESVTGNKAGSSGASGNGSSATGSSATGSSATGSSATGSSGSVAGGSGSSASSGSGGNAGSAASSGASGSSSSGSSGSSSGGSSSSSGSSSSGSSGGSGSTTSSGADTSESATAGADKNDASDTFDTKNSETAAAIVDAGYSIDVSHVYDNFASQTNQDGSVTSTFTDTTTGSEISFTVAENGATVTQTVTDGQATCVVSLEGASGSAGAGANSDVIELPSVCSVGAGVAEYTFVTGGKSKKVAFALGAGVSAANVVVTKSAAGAGAAQLALASGAEGVTGGLSAAVAGAAAALGAGASDTFGMLSTSSAAAQLAVECRYVSVGSLGASVQLSASEGYCYSVSAVSVSFADVASTAWYAQAVEYVAAHGVMNGMGGAGSDTFAPEELLTRGMMAQLLQNKSVVDGGAESSASASASQAVYFDDVSSSDWYASAANWAAELGIFTGYDGCFDGNSNITREQVATILWRLAGSPSVDDAAAALGAFPDGESVSNYARQAVSWCVENGVITGNNGSILPQACATRAEIAAMIQRFDALFI